MNKNNDYLLLVMKINAVFQEKREKQDVIFTNIKYRSSFTLEASTRKKKRNKINV